MDMHLNLKSFKGPIVYYVRKEVRGGGGWRGVQFYKRLDFVGSILKLPKM